MSELQVGSVRAQYGNIVAVRDATFRVPHGGAVGVIGANGAGKSTLMRVIAGLHRPSAGCVHIGSTDMTGRSARRMVRSGVSLVPEGRRIFADLSVEDNLLLGGYSIGKALRPLRKRTSTVYDLFPRLHERRAQIAGTLSGGEQQMLAIGRGLMSAPSLLLLDEPSLGLAPRLAIDLMDKLVELREATDLTLVLVEQNLPMVQRVVDTCVVLEHGVVTFEVSAAEVLYDARVQAAYLGSATKEP